MADHFLRPDPARLAAIAYHSVGIYTEGGRNPYTRIPNAGGASGFSVSVFQLDFKQRPQTAVPYAQAVVDWHKENGKSAPVNAETFAQQLQNPGALSPEMRNAARSFGESAAGREWIHNNIDKPLIDEAVKAAEKAFATPYGQMILREGKHVEEFAAFSMKVNNQYGKGKERGDGKVHLPGHGALLDYLNDGSVKLRDNSAEHSGEVKMATMKSRDKFDAEDFTKEFAGTYMETRRVFNQAVTKGPSEALKSGALYGEILNSQGPLADVLKRAEQKGGFSPEQRNLDPDLALTRALFGMEPDNARQIVKALDNPAQKGLAQQRVTLGEFPATLWADPANGKLALRYDGEPGAGWLLSKEGYAKIEASRVEKVNGVRTLVVGLGDGAQTFDKAPTPQVHGAQRATTPAASGSDYDVQLDYGQIATDMQGTPLGARSQPAPVPVPARASPPAGPASQTNGLTRHTDGSYEVASTASRDGVVGDIPVRRGDFISQSYSAAGKLTHLAVWHSDGRVSRDDLVFNPASGQTLRTFSHWDASGKLLARFSTDEQGAVAPENTAKRTHTESSKYQSPPPNKREHDNTRVSEPDALLNAYLRGKATGHSLSQAHAAPAANEPEMGAPAKPAPALTPPTPPTPTGPTGSAGPKFRL